MDDKHQFMMEEYKSLRREVEIYLVELRSLERYSVIAVGTIWAWLIHERIESWFGWFIPLLLTSALLGRYVVFHQHFGMLRRHLTATEAAFGVSGWETSPRSSAFRSFHTALGIALVLMSAAALYWRAGLIARPASDSSRASSIVSPLIQPPPPQPLSQTPQPSPTSAPLVPPLP